MSGIPDWQWDEIQRGRDPDSLSRERARDEGFERTQRESEREIDRWKLDVERDRGLQQTAASSTSPRIVSPREDIRLCRRDILDSIQFCVWLDRNLKDDWRSRLANLTDAGWQEELAELRRDVARETEAWRRANATVSGVANSTAISCATSESGSSISSSNAQMFKRQLKSVRHCFTVMPQRNTPPERHTEHLFVYELCVAAD